MEVQLEQRQGFAILRIAGDLRLWGYPDLEAQILSELRALPTLPSQLILSMGGITRLDTAGIRPLVRVVIECTKRDIAPKVVLPGSVAGQALRQLHIFDAWPEFPDEAAAIQSIAGAKAPEERTPMDEQRRHPRLECTSEVWIGQDGIFSQTTERIANISIGGVFIETAGTFSRGTILSIRFKIGESGTLISSSAIVRNPRPGVGLGVEFLDLSPEAKHNLETFLISQLGPAL